MAGVHPALKHLSKCLTQRNSLTSPFIVLLLSWMKTVSRRMAFSEWSFPFSRTKKNAAVFNAESHLRCSRRGCLVQHFEWNGNILMCFSFRWREYGCNWLLDSIDIERREKKTKLDCIILIRLKHFSSFLSLSFDDLLLKYVREGNRRSSVLTVSQEIFKAFFFWFNAIWKFCFQTE